MELQQNTCQSLNISQWIVNKLPHLKKMQM